MHNFYQDAIPYSPLGEGPSVESPDASQRVCDYATYMQLLQENAELHRANRLLQVRRV